MSLAHELRVLDLNSQTELLDRVRLLTQFGSNFIAITGAKGSGKTWIAQRFLEAYSQDKNQSLLMCHPNQSDEQKRTILLNQVVASPLFNENDPIADSFSRLIGDNRSDLVIVIDDAQLLSETLLAELWALVLEAQSNAAWNINVVLFSDSNSLEPVLSRLSYGQENKPISLEIEQLREQEVESFLELLVLRFVHEESAKKKVRKEAKKTAALPGALMALGERKTERTIIIRSIIGSPIKIAIVAIVLLLIILGGYLWFFTQPDPVVPVTTTEGQTEQLVEEMETLVPAEQMVLSPAGESNVETLKPEEAEKPAEIVSENGTEDSDELPPTVTENIQSVGSSDEGQRVVVPSNVVDALLKGEETEETAVIDQAVEQAKEQAAAPEPENATQESAPPLITFSFAKDELLAVSDTNYTLQLAALLSLEQVQDFLLVHELENKVRIYPTVRAGVDWYIVTYQDYPTIQQARNAREALPPSVQILEPWAKSMLQVHREIRRAN